LNFAFKAVLWRWQGDAPAAWHFITLPADVAAQVKFFSGKSKGFGSVRVAAVIGTSRWRTSLFPDSKSGSYLLPVKAEVRKAEAMTVGTEIAVRIQLDV
jgi:Domain of unknown function (DUF1905)